MPDITGMGTLEVPTQSFQQFCEEGSVIQQREVKFSQNIQLMIMKNKQELIGQIHWKCFLAEETVFTKVV